MNVKTLFTFVAFCFTGLIGSADSVPFQFEPDNEDTPTKEIPITGDYDESSKELALKFSESSTYNVDVYSEKGLIYSARVTVDTYEEVRIAVRGYADEACTVVVTDSKGHRYQGDFFA